MSNSGYEYDIFISYRFRNNTPTGGDEGWITNLHTDLQIVLPPLLGRGCQIWRDQGSNSAPLVDALQNAVNRAAVLIIVMFPDFIDSQWCLKELSWFIDDNESRGGAGISNKSRVFAIRTMPLDQERTPGEVQDLPGYDFFEFDYVTQRLLILKRGISKKADSKYWSRIRQLATDICNTLTLISQQETD